MSASDNKGSPSDIPQHPEPQSPLKTSTSQVEDNNQIVMVQSGSAQHNLPNASIAHSLDEDISQHSAAIVKKHSLNPSPMSLSRVVQDPSEIDPDKTMEMVSIRNNQQQLSLAHEGIKMPQRTLTRTWKRAVFKDGRLQR
ncbi:N-system amino acid transporter 1 [Striga asiatica]|uniref:N-system amino acid transporter 1 n=1 Tax=Striga asiatica TaxID=4170 RepID=A0A5A7PWD3_STRAF|nr:N-system amino acid transporter 1 [Striga asiatica]